MSLRCTTHFHACDCREEKFKLLEQRLKEAEEALSFYADPEMWMIKNRDGWIQNSPKSYGDNELIRDYKHPKTDWSGSIQVGGKRARAYFEKYGEKEGV